MIEPTNRLMEISRRYGVGMTYFVDVGYLLALERAIPDFPQLKNDYDKVVAQLQQMMQKGDDVQLHIHPHWEKSIFTGTEWDVRVDGAYKLADFPQHEIEEIVVRYKAKLEEIIQREVTAFRAGGWCLQPFSLVKDVFERVGIRMDSTVYPGGYFESDHYYYDFRTAPKEKGCYRFKDDLCVEAEDGPFTEFPIAGWKYSPLFYWELYLRGRMNPIRHKMLGDGMYIPQPGRKWKNLTSYNWNHVSCDGFFASKLNQITRVYSKQGRSDLVIIGHPKSMTHYSFEQLEAFIANNHQKHTFKTFADVQQELKP